MASMSNDVAILRDRVQQKDLEMSTNHGRLQEVSQQIDVDARRRMNDSDYNMSRLEERLDLNMNIRKDWTRS